MPKTNYVCTLTPDQVQRTRELMEPGGWEFDGLPYAHWRARKDKTTVVAYQSGKCVVQGKGTAEFVQFLLEPEILGQAKFGYEHLMEDKAANPEMFAPHAGIDESGKGDYFGPLVTAAVYVDGTTASKLLELGVTDSKAIKSDKRIAAMAGDVRKIVRGAFSLVAIGPEAYNRTYQKIGNVNRLLAWAHARCLEDLLAKVPDCPRAISDQFGRKETVQRALMERGKKIKLEQFTKAESDIAVAAASILARADFVHRLDLLGRQHGLTLPKGAGSKVDEVAAELAAKGGRELLGQVAKLHFRTTDKALGGQ